VASHTGFAAGALRLEAPVNTLGDNMSLSPLSRFAVPLTIVAGALVIVTRLVTMLTVPAEIEPLTAYVLTTTHAVNSILSIVAFALLAVALVAVYDLEAREAGGLGALAVAAAIVGTVFMAGDWWYEAFAVPRLAEVAPEAIETFVGGRLLAGGLLSFLLFGIGWVLFGIASQRAHVFPGAASIGILIGGLLSGVPIGLAYLSGGVVLGLAFVGLGVSLMQSSSSAGGVAAPAA
jgi:hypothetical protein